MPTAGVNNIFESFTRWNCVKNINTSRLGVANDSSVFLTTLKHSIVSKISPGAVETTLKIGTNNLQKMLILIGRRRRPKKIGLFPPHFETLGGKFSFPPPHISRPWGGNDFGLPPHMGGENNNPWIDLCSAYYKWNTARRI